MCRTPPSDFPVPTMNSLPGGSARSVNNALEIPRIADWGTKELRIRPAGPPRTRKMPNAPCGRPWRSFIPSNRPRPQKICRSVSASPPALSSSAKRPVRGTSRSWRSAVRPISPRVCKRWPPPADRHRRLNASLGRQRIRTDRSWRTCFERDRGSRSRLAGGACLGGGKLQFDAHRGGSALTPLVGRDEELDLLLRRWSQARDGEGQVVLLSRANPGSAKGTGAKLGVRRQRRLAGMSRWLDGISVHTQNRTFRYRPRTEPEAVGRRRAVTSAFADFCSSGGSPGNWLSLR